MSIVAALKELNIEINKISLRESTNFENITTNISVNNQQKLNYINVVDYDNFILFKFFKDFLKFNNKLKIRIADVWDSEDKNIKIT